VFFLIFRSPIDVLLADVDGLIKEERILLDRRRRICRFQSEHSLSITYHLTCVSCRKHFVDDSFLSICPFCGCAADHKVRSCDRGRLDKRFEGCVK